MGLLTEPQRLREARPGNLGSFLTPRRRSAPAMGTLYLGGTLFPTRDESCALSRVAADAEGVAQRGDGGEVERTTPFLPRSRGRNRPVRKRYETYSSP